MSEENSSRPPEQTWVPPRVVVRSQSPDFPGHVTSDWLEERGLDDTDVVLIRGLYWFAGEWGMKGVAEVARKLAGPENGSHVMSTLVREMPAELSEFDFPGLFMQLARAAKAHGVMVNISFTPLDDEELEDAEDSIAALTAPGDTVSLDEVESNLRRQS